MSGKPVLIEDTGFDDWLAVGRGVVTYRDLAEAAAGVESTLPNRSAPVPKTFLPRTKSCRHFWTRP